MNITIAGAFTHNIIDSLIKLKKHLKVTVYDGPNNCPWNGGRINRNIQIDIKDIEKYNKLDIRVALTFSNPNIDLTNEVGLSLLRDMHRSQLLHGVRNEIILINEDFREYLRLNWEFILKFSITGHDLEAYPDEVLQKEYIKYYKDLEWKYDIIVPKMEHIFQEWFYKNVSVSKYEIMLNDTCRPNCQYYKQHFEEIARLNTIFQDQESAYEYNNILAKSVEECWLPNFDPNNELTSCSTGMDLDQELLNKARKIGYGSFKISGRENEKEDMINEIFKVTRMGISKSL